MRLLFAAQQQGRHVCHSRADAVRVAEDECRAQKGALVGIVPCDRCSSVRFRTVVCSIAVDDCVAPRIDVLRATPYNKWSQCYADLVRRSPPTAQLSARGLFELRPAPKPTVKKGIWFWRWYYGAPCMSPAEMIAHHVASMPSWDPTVLAPKDTACAYTTKVRAAVLSLVERFAEHLARAGRTLDTKLLVSAIMHPDFRVLLLPPDARLAGALYPLHALTKRDAATEADYTDNRRVLAVQRLGVVKLRPLLAHEIAHCFFPPVWMRENHPPAFRDFEAELAPFAQKVALA
jgi:hypothetical protein